MTQLFDKATFSFYNLNDNFFIHIYFLILQECMKTEQREYIKTNPIENKELLLWNRENVF